MHGPFVLLDDDGTREEGRRIYVGESPGRNEAWLRDTLLSHPGTLPVDEIDPAFGPLIPLCRELRTDAGPVDAVFINERGRLTIVECKLWRNPQARREVVAQALDYVASISSWTYADLQRQVSSATRRQGNVPFEAVRAAGSQMREADFVDAVSRSLREGRVLVLVAGDGIREGLRSLAELVNRTATKAFSFGLVEVAMYQFGGGRLVIQPRVLVETEVLTRNVTLIATNGEYRVEEIEAENEPPAPIPGRGREHLREFWSPLLQMRFDDPEQEPPTWLPATNNLTLATPFPGIRIKAYRNVDGGSAGVFISGTKADNVESIREFIIRDRRILTRELPARTLVDPNEAWPVQIRDDQGTVAEHQRWLRETLNAFVNVLRPRLKKWYEESKA